MADQKTPKPKDPGQTDPRDNRVPSRLGHGDEGARVEQHLAQLRVHAACGPQQRQAGQRGDGDAHFVRHAQAAAAEDGLFGQEDLHQPLEPQLLARRQAAQSAVSALEAQAEALRGSARLLIDAHQVWGLDHD